MGDKAILERFIRAYIDADHLVEALNYLQWGKANEIAIMGNLMRIQQAWPYFADVMAGAHVEIADDHARYHAWSKLPPVGGRPYGRGSSHSSIDPQYAVDGPFTHTILFGNRRNVTWLQLERTPYGGGVVSKARHILDWWKYGQSKRNQGPYGDSELTDKRPLVFVPK